MQALRCLLRSRQELGSRSISAVLTQTTQYSFAALQAPENLSSHVHSGNTPRSIHSHFPSSTTLPQHLYGYTPHDTLGYGHPCCGGGCLGDTGWTRQALYNIPNTISIARLVSGPVIAWLVLSEQWGIALVSLVISGASDWADGYVAKRYNQSSVLGSYLDPLADKVLIGCIVGALGYQGSLPAPLVALIIGRDLVLLSGAFVHRFKAVGWRWPGLAEFFRVASPSSLPSPPTDDAVGSETAALGHPATSSISSQQRSTEVQGTQATRPAGMDGSTAVAEPVDSLQTDQQELQNQPAPANKGSIPPAAFVQPLYISKVNTCFQLLLVSGCLSSSWYAWPTQETILVLGLVTGGTTLASCIAYVRVFLTKPKI